MSTTQLIQTIIEVLVIAAVIIGFLYEPVIAEWEQKQSEKMLRAFNKRKEYRR